MSPRPPWLARGLARGLAAAALPGCLAFPGQMRECEPWIAGDYGPMMATSLSSCLCFLILCTVVSTHMMIN